jgi:hypothetical protein
MRVILANHRDRAFAIGIENEAGFRIEGARSKAPRKALSASCSSPKVHQRTNSIEPSPKVTMLQEAKAPEPVLWTIRRRPMMDQQDETDFGAATG